MRRAVAYVRVTETTEDLGGQRSIIEAWAAREEVAIAALHEDVGVDGSTPIAERPGLVAAYRAIRATQSEVLVASDASRFTNDELVWRLVEQAARTAGAVLWTVDGSRVLPAGTTDRGARDVGYTRGAVDLARAYERVTLRARIRAALAEKKARGERVGNVPFGYRLANDGVHTEPDDREQHVIASVRRLSSAGLSQRAIARELAALGVVGRTGAPLRQTQISSILRGAG